jgi:hypothetical protein
MVRQDQAVTPNTSSHTRPAAARPDPFRVATKQKRHDEFEMGDIDLRIAN